MQMCVLKYALMCVHINVLGEKVGKKVGAHAYIFMILTGLCADT